MPRYVTYTGVVVNISEDKAERLGSQVTPYVAEKAKAPAKKAASKKSNN